MKLSSKHMKYAYWLIVMIASTLTTISQPREAVIKEVSNITQKQYSSLEKLYRQLHQQPELSLHEVKTSAIIAGELRQLGFEVIEKIGGYSLVGILKNGDGPTVLIRTDMDALPLEEKTGLPYASKEKAINATGNEVA